MKNSYLLTSLAVILLVGGGCSPAPRPASTAVVPEGYQTHDAKYFHFSISYPTNWEVEANNDNGTAVQIFSPAETNNDNFAENLNVIERTLPGKVSLESFVEGGRTKNQEIEGYKEISYTDITLDGYPGKRLEYVATPAMETGETLPVRLVQYGTVTPKTAFTLTCTLTEERAKEYLETCDKMAASFKIHEETVQ